MVIQGLNFGYNDFNAPFERGISLSAGVNNQIALFNNNCNNNIDNHPFLKKNLPIEEKMRQEQNSDMNFLLNPPPDNPFLKGYFPPVSNSENVSAAFRLVNPQFGQLAIAPKLKTQKQKDNETLESFTAKTAIESLPPFRRAVSIPDQIKKGDVIPALGAAGLVAINFPEDSRDIKTAWQQVCAFFKGQKYEGPYNYKEFQHEFSFFRGTLLGSLIDKSKHPILAEKLFKLDKSLLKTNFGDKILSLLHVEWNGFEKVKKYNSKTKTWELAKDINGCQRIAPSHGGKWFGNLTARALSRTTLIGTGIVAAIELFRIAKASTNGDTIEEKVKNGAKQTLNSGISFALTTAGIGYGGALLAKHGKGLGSIVGMGLGAIIGSKLAEKMQDSIE